MDMNITKYRQWMGHKGPVYAMNQVDESQFISAGSDGYIIKWDIDAALQGRVLAHVPAQVFSLEYIEDLHHLLAGAMDGHLYVIDLNNNSCIRNIDLQSGSVFSILKVADIVFVATQMGLLYQLNDCYELTHTIKVSDASLRKLIATKDRTSLFIASSDKCIYTYQISIGQITDIIRAANHSVFSLAFDETHKLLYSGSRDAQLYKHTFNENQISTEQIAAHLYTINDIVLNSTHSLLYTASRDKSIKVWNSETLQLLKVIDQKFDAHKNSVNKLLYYPERNLLISAGDDSAVIAWRIEQQIQDIQT